MLKCSLDSKKRSSCYYPPYGLGPSTVYGTVPGISLDVGLPLLVCMLQATRSWLNGCLPDLINSSTAASQLLEARCS
jgi:hypothetical protein